MSVNKILVNNNDSNYTHSIFDISEYTGNSYSTLSDALDAIPQAKCKGGITIRYIDSNDKYVQYRLMSDTFNTTPANWQGVDDEPTAGSNNLVKSGGVANGLDNLNILTGLELKESPKDLVVGTIYQGILTNSKDCLVDINYIYVKANVLPNSSLNIIKAPDIRVRITEYDENKIYITNSGEYSDIKSIILQQNTKFIRISASYSNRGFSDENPITIDDYQEGDFGILLPQSDRIDEVPIAGSDNLVKSGGIQNELALGAVYDVSAKNPTAGPNNDGKWESLNALLSDADLNTLIPTSVRKGGMSIKFIQFTPASYTVVKTEGLDSQPTGTEIFSDPDIYSGTYNASQLSAFSTLPESTGAGNAVTYWIEDAGDTTTYTSWVITMAHSSAGNKYVQYFLTKDGWSAYEADWQNWEEVGELVSTRFYGVFVNGGLRNGVLEPLNRYRISSKEILSYDREIEITAKSGFRFGIHFFENGVFVRDSGWQYSSAKIQKDVTFKVVIARVTESQSEVANIDEFLSGVYVTSIIDSVNTKIAIIEQEIELVYSSFGMSESKIEYPTRNGSKNNTKNAYAVIWLDIPCAGYKKIRFRINKTFIASGNIFAFCYTLPNGGFRDNIPGDIQNGFYQDTQDKWLELSCDGLQTITIQAYETSLPSSYPDTFSPLRKEGFLLGEGLQYYFFDQTVDDLSATIGRLDSLTTTDKSDIVHAINSVADVTNKYNLFRVIEGKGQTFSDGYIYGLQSGQKYIFNLSKTSWDITGVEQGNYFAISNWYNGSSYVLFQAYNKFPQTNEIEFTVPQNSDFIAIGGRAAVGEKITGYITDVPKDENPEKMLVHKKMVSTYYGNQGLTIVGDTIIQFNSGADNHSSYAAVRRWSKEDFTFIDGMTHNLGHAATVDYDSTTDALVVGNGTSDTSVAPRLDIVLDASSKFADGSPLNYNDSDILHIELKTNKKEIGGSGLICCYGGNWREVFLATGQNAPRKFFRCLLGVGEEDFSDNTVEQNDVTSWGTFIPGKTNTEYNGTLKVLSTYTGEETQVYQGMCYRAGFIYLACGYSQPLVHKIRLYTNGRYKIVQTNIPQDYNADGSLKSVEPEGLCFYDEATMLIALPSYGGLFQIEAF